MKAKLIDNIYKRKNHYVFKDNWYIINPKRKCQNGKANFYITTPITGIEYLPYAYGTDLVEAVFLNGEQI